LIFLISSALFLAGHPQQPPAGFPQPQQAPPRSSAPPQQQQQQQQDPALRGDPKLLVSS